MGGAQAVLLPETGLGESESAGQTALASGTSPGPGFCDLDVVVAAPPGGGSDSNAAGAISNKDR